MKVFLALLLVMFLASCASDTPQIIRITEENRHEEFDGLRFYEPEEYLSVGKKHDVKEDGVVEITEENGKRTRITEAIILPKERLIGEIVLMKNERKEYVIIGAHNVTLIDGWMLEGFYAKDSVLQKVSKKNLLHILDGAEGLTPGLYQFIKNEQGIVTSLKKIRVVQ